MSDNKYGVYIGRFNPVHLGHCMVIKAMLETFTLENSLIIIGSCNTKISLRHYFSYVERSKFITSLFPGIKIVGLPDYANDEDWIIALDDLLRFGKIDPEKTTFFGGCREDLIFFEERNRHCQFLNRFDGTTPKISATEVRDALVENRPLDGLIHDAIASDVTRVFREKWEMFKKM